MLIYVIKYINIIFTVYSICINTTFKKKINNLKVLLKIQIKENIIIIYMKTVS